MKLKILQISRRSVMVSWLTSGRGVDTSEQRCRMRTDMQPAIVKETSAYVLAPENNGCPEGIPLPPLVHIYPPDFTNSLPLSRRRFVTLHITHASILQSILVTNSLIVDIDSRPQRLPIIIKGILETTTTSIVVS
jgi:hypothetical protein